METMTTLSFPAGAVSETITVTVGMTSTPPITGGFSFLGQAFFIDATTSDGTPVTDFAQPFTITIQYSDEDVVGIDESSLTLSYWDAGTETWIPLPTTVDTEANTLTAVVEHLTTFAVIGESRPEHRIYLPLVIRESQPGRDDRSPPKLMPRVVLITGAGTIVLVFLIDNLSVRRPIRRRRK
jgi:hypothetical protein